MNDHELRYLRWLFGLDLQGEPIDADNANVLTGRNRSLGPRPPNLAVNAHPALVSRPVENRSDVVDHVLRPRDHDPAPRARQQGQHRHERAAGDQGNAADQLPGDGEPRHVGVHQHDRADDEGGDAANSQNAETGQEHFRRHQRHAERGQGQTRIIDGQNMKCVERQQQANAADHPGPDQTGAVELEQQPVDPDQHENVGHIGIGDERQEFGPPIGFQRLDGETGCFQAPRRALDHHLAAVQLDQQAGNIVGDEIDHVFLERFVRRQAGGLAHRLFRPRDVAAPHLREAANVGPRIVFHFPLGRRRCSPLGRRFFPAFLRVRPVLRRRWIRRLRRRGRAADAHGRGGAEIGSRRHRRHMAGVTDIGAGAGRARAARRHVADHGYRRRQDGPDDVPHGGIEAAGRIHSHNDQRGVLFHRLLEAARHVVAGRRSDRSLDLQDHGDVGRARRRL